MKEKVIIWGTGSAAIGVYNRVKNIFDVVCFFDNNEQKIETFLCGIPVRKFDKKYIQSINEVKILIASTFSREIVKQLKIEDLKEDIDFVSYEKVNNYIKNRVCPYLEKIYNNNDFMDYVYKKNSEPPFFSIVMPAHNDISIINASINSLITQSFTSWELIIYDDSTNGNDVWDIIEQKMNIDSRIKGFRSGTSLGLWKKVSMFLECAKGKYITSLGTDDCFNKDILNDVYSTVVTENPDVVLIGNAYVGINDTEKYLKDVIIPKHKYYINSERLQMTLDLFDDTYYASFLHYIKLDILKKYNIDFFSPYHSDLVSMAKLLTVTKRIITISKVGYFLTIGTSQEKGWYTWDFYKDFDDAWIIFKTIFEKGNISNIEGIKKVMVSYIGTLEDRVRCLCMGKIKDIYMSPIYKGVNEVLRQIEDIITNLSVLEMVYILGKKDFFEYLIEIITIVLNNYEINRDYLEKNWIGYLVDFVMDNSKDSRLIFLEKFVLSKENIIGLGEEYLYSISKDREDVLLNCWQNVISARKVDFEANIDLQFLLK